MSSNDLDQLIKSIKWSSNWEPLGYVNPQGEWVDVLTPSEWDRRLLRLARRGLSMRICGGLRAIGDAQILSEVERLPDESLAALTAADAVNPEVEAK
ncbi:hypothetical protein [Kribbella deserti]|uniref:Uncharacterized protein n=1 Tax=Kribbella deserti TaxID=1926257 RepID=A0ABV6QQ72_9ACTN